MPQNIKTGNNVQYFPNEKRRKKLFPLATKFKKCFAAIVNDVNDLSVDLSILAGDGKVTEVKNVPHLTESGDGRSYWDYIK